MLYIIDDGNTIPCPIVQLIMSTTIQQLSRAIQHIHISSTEYKVYSAYVYVYATDLDVARILK